MRLVISLTDGDDIEVVSDVFRCNRSLLLLGRIEDRLVGLLTKLGSVPLYRDDIVTTIDERGGNVVRKHLIE